MSRAATLLFWKTGQTSSPRAVREETCPTDFPKTQPSKNAAEESIPHVEYFFTPFLLPESLGALLNKQRSSPHEKPVSNDSHLSHLYGACAAGQCPGEQRQPTVAMAR